MSPPSAPPHSAGATRARELLVVTYHFPPIQTAGVYRVVGLVKYLKALGWRATVLTVRRSTHEGGDDASLDLIPPGVDVIRTPSFEPASMLVRAAGRSRERGGPSSTPSASVSAPSGRRRLRGLLARPWRVLVDALSYPDFQVFWTPRVAWEVVAFVRRHPRAIVLSSTPPHSTQVGVRLARAFARFGWVADFRDPWTAPLRQPKGRANLALQRALERWVLSRCDHVVVNTEGNRERLLASFPHLDVGRVTVVTNAFDTATLPPPAPADDPALACDLAYFGELYPGMLDAYFDAARAWKGRRDAHAPRLHVFGRVGADDERRVAAAGLSSHIVFMGSVSYARSLALMRGSRALLLLLPDGGALATCVPSKLYPYLFSRRPVLALVPPGDAARVVAETRAGEIVHPGDAESVAAGVLAFVERARRGEVTGAPGSADIAEYAMDRAAARVHRILLEVARG